MTAFRVSQTSGVSKAGCSFAFALDLFAGDIRQVELGEDEALEVSDGADLYALVVG